MIRFEMAIGYVSKGERGEITVLGFAASKKKAKTDAYRRGMSRLKRLTGDERYTVLYAQQISFREISENECERRKESES